jgi:hypothetical protein
MSFSVAVAALSKEGLLYAFCVLAAVIVVAMLGRAPSAIGQYINPYLP